MNSNLSRPKCEREIIFMEKLMQHLEYMTAAYILIWVAIFLYFLSCPNAKKRSGKNCENCAPPSPKTISHSHGRKKRQKNFEPKTPKRAAGRTKIPHRRHSPVRGSPREQRTRSSNSSFAAKASPATNASKTSTKQPLPKAFPFSRPTGAPSKACRTRIPRKVCSASLPCGHGIAHPFSIPMAHSSFSTASLTPVTWA